MASAPDPVPVAKHDDEHLRRFLLARRAGDTVEMRRWWGLLVEDFHERIRLRVAYESTGQLDRDEREDAVQLCLESFADGLFRTFDGTTMGELVNAMKRLVHFRCIDIQRKEARHSGASLDGGWDEEDSDRPTPDWEYDQAKRQFADAETGKDFMGFLAWALPQLPARPRRVAELMLASATTEEICAEFEVSVPNAHQLRSRASKELRQLKEQYDA